MKDEKLMLIVVCGLFSAVLVGIDVWYSSCAILFSRDTFWGVLAALMHLSIVLVWIWALAKYDDPNYDKLRKWLMALLVGAILIVAIHHSLVVEDEQVIIDSQQNATE